MKLKKLFFLPLLLLGVTVSACGNKEETLPTWNASATPITDSLKFEQADSLEGKRFAYLRGVEAESDHVGYVTLRSCTDGDTSNFIQDDYKDNLGAYISIKTRYLGVNTPESTAKVEPWGKKASVWAKGVLEAAQAAADEATAKDASGKIHHNIALINHPSSKGGPFEEADSSGNRWLAFVWYRQSEESNWRLLNLELVERGYSKNQLFDKSSVCNYFDSFKKAEQIAIAYEWKDPKWGKGKGARVQGEYDPDYDYENTVFETNLWYVINHYSELGISEESGGTSGVQLHITALVVGSQGDNMFLRDVLHHKEQTDDEYASLYAYSGYNSSICSLLQAASKAQGLNNDGLGVVVSFYCRATKYSGNIQLSDVQNKTTGKKAFVSINANNFSKYAQNLAWSREYEAKGTEFSFADLNKNYEPINVDPTTLTSTEDLGAYKYSFITTVVKIRSVTVGDLDEDGAAIGEQQIYWYKGNANDSSYTVYAEITGKDGARILTNLRIDTSLYPFIEHAFWGTDDATDVSSEKSPVGKYFKVTGYVQSYFEKYQITLPNNYSDMHYVGPVVD